MHIKHVRTRLSLPDNYLVLPDIVTYNKRKRDPLRGASVNRFVFSKKSSEPELPACITPELAAMSIRISTDGYPETGAIYYEGTIRTFVIERLPHQQLVERLPELLMSSSFIYRPSTETLRVERIDAS